MSRRTLVLAALAAAAATAAPAQSPRPAPEPSPAVFASGVEMVTVDAVVLGQDGRPVEGLKAGDFVVKEDGKAQAVTAFEASLLAESAPTEVASRSRISTNAAPPPRAERLFAVVFDDANLTQYTSPRARQAIVDLIREGLRDGDQVTVVPTAGGAWWTGRLPEDRERLLAFVGRLEGKWRPSTGADRIWDHEAMAITLGRDPKMMAYVARRYFENNLIPESYPSYDAVVARELDVSPGLALIRMKAQETYTAATSRLRATLDTLARVADSLAPVRGRKNILLVSEGFILDRSQTEFRELVQAARRGNTAVHFLDAKGPEGFLGQPGMPGGSADQGRDVEEQDTSTVWALAGLSVEGSRSVASDTGGTVVPATAGLARAMARIVEQSRAYYLLGYVSSNKKRDGHYRKIEVAVSRPGLEVQARRGYYAPREGEVRKPDPDRLEPAVRAALDAPFASGALPLRLTSYVFGPAPEGKVQVVLAAEVDVASLGLVPRGGRVSLALDTFVLVDARDAAQAARQQKLLEMDLPEAHLEQVRRGGVPIAREFQLAPGPYQARLLVRDKASGRLGSVRHEFEVPEPGRLRVSTPILTDGFQTGGPSGPPRPMPVAHRAFRAGSRLGYAFEVHGAAPDPVAGGPRVKASHVVRSADGREVLSSASRPLTAAAVGAAPSQLVLFEAPAQPGDYSVELKVVDEAGGQTLDVTDPFTVVP